MPVPAGALGPVGAWTSANPFFRPERCAEGADPTSAMLAPNVPPFSAEGVRLPRELLAAHEHGAHDVQLASGVVLMSLEEVRVRDAEARAQGQQRVVAFAFLYAGMGHVRLFSYDPVDRLVGATWDGGSNDHDRTRALRERLALDPSTLEGRQTAAEWLRWASAPAGEGEA